MIGNEVFIAFCSFFSVWERNEMLLKYMSFDFVDIAELNRLAIIMKH